MKLHSLLALIVFQGLKIYYVIGLPDIAFWENEWPSDLTDRNFQFPPSTGLENPYVVFGQSNLSNIGNDPSATGLANIFNNNAPLDDEVEVKTENGSWISKIYLPDANQISDLSKFQITVTSAWSVDIYLNSVESKRVNNGEVLILALIAGVWHDEDSYNQIATSSTSEDENQTPDLLPGTVLFAQSQIIPSKHRNDGDDTQPHLVAMRKTLVMFKPHTDSLPEYDLLDGEDMMIEMLVYDGDGNIVATFNSMSIPENIPKHDSWLDLGDEVDFDDINFPTELTDPYVIKYQSNLNNIADDQDAIVLTETMNAPNQYEVEIKTQNGAWVRNIYFPKGVNVSQDSKIQITCNSAFSVNIYYPLADGEFRTKIYSNGDKEIAILVNGFWVAENDLAHNEYIFGHGFYTATIPSEWVQPGMSLEFSTFLHEDSEYVGILDNIDIGAPTELILTLLDAGFLTEPRDEFTFKDDLTTHREYFETAPLSRLITVQYETMHLTEIMLPDGTFYTDVSDDDGGWHSGDMRQYIGKLLLSHGIDLANYGINSSKGHSESSHPFTCALLAAHNTVGFYQNGRIVHGGSGGNGMVTLDSSIGNEFSHELGHNYGLGHYVDGFRGSVHRPASEINSSWGWDSERNVFYPNFSQVASGSDQCLEGDCQTPYLGKYKYGVDSMAGGSPQYRNRFTFYTPNSSRKIQSFLESKAIWDPSSSTGFRKFNPFTKKMEEFVNPNVNKVPIKFHVPVTTIVGYYDPENSGLPSYIYPALHGALGFVYDGDYDLGEDDCKLVVKTNSGQGTPIEYSLSGSLFTSDYMNKFHVNVATEDEPYEALVYCGNTILVSRALDGPNDNEPPLEYTVTGVPLTSSLPSSSPSSTPVVIPTSPPITCDTHLFKMTVLSDSSGGETSYELIRSDGTVVFSDADLISNAAATEEACLVEGEKYTFKITDIDGICCSQGNGSYLLTLDGSKLSGGGNFTEYEKVTFRP